MNAMSEMTAGRQSAVVPLALLGSHFVDEDRTVQSQAFVRVSSACQHVDTRSWVSSGERRCWTTVGTVECCRRLRTAPRVRLKREPSQTSPRVIGKCTPRRKQTISEE